MDQETPSLTPAAEFNRKVFNRIQRALEKDPEVDLTTVFPARYAGRLAEKVGENTSHASEIPSTVQGTPDSQQTETTVQLSDHEEDAVLPFGLTRDLEEFLGLEKQHSNAAYDGRKIMSGIRKAIQGGKFLFQSEVSSNHMVVHCTDTIVMKVQMKSHASDYTEFTSMRHLQAKLPDIPAPRPLGVVSSGLWSYTFMTYVPGASLDTVWPMLDEKQKKHVVSQLNKILERMRKHRCPPNTPLGGVGGEGCNDARRHPRICPDQLFRATDFVDFLFSNPHFGGSVYIDFLRRFWQTRDTSIVFTHGDLQPPNIMVERKDDGNYQVTGLIDWENSGYYPDWFECVKATNNLSTLESDDDWSLFLPACISPQRYALQWLLDCVWDRHVA